MKILSDEMLRGIVKYLNRDMELHGVVTAGNECDYRLDVGKLDTACDEAAFCGEEDEPDAAWEAFQAAVTANPELSRLRKIMANADGNDRSAGESHRAVTDFWDAIEADHAVHQLFLASLQLGEPRASATGVFLENTRRTRSMNELRTPTGFSLPELDLLEIAHRSLARYGEPIAGNDHETDQALCLVRNRLQKLIEEKLR